MGANEISNTATIYYNDNGVDKSAQSNTVITAVTTPTPTGVTINLSLQLQGRNDFTTIGTNLKVYPTGQQTTAFEKNDIATDTQGNATFTVDLAAGNYDFKIKAANYLTKTLTNIALVDPLPLNLGQLSGGDLDNNNLVNSLDFSYLLSKWDQSDAIADINQDSIVNTIDFSVLNSNYGVGGY